ncbi:hypothetical protein POM88_050997 [Heracleum sosnowskyi]|uniref:ORC6 second cyclin-like domain-containing protein n=1 Tax=Heracleum sosnowskyi TaxID=360622 RepID=A0AAD8GZR0_9APIA|nr:hypothetical protein POM88_050997 [Heracleum sosnowskyi]
MSKFIDNVETFDFTTDQYYSEKIDGLLKRFPKYEKDDRFRTVLPDRIIKTADDFISMKFCTRGRVPIHVIYNRRDFNLIGVCVETIMYLLDDASCHFHSSFVPDLKVRKVVLGIQDTPLATHETLNYTKQSICSAISTLSLGYMPEKKNEWCDAIVLLIGMTSQAVRFHNMNNQIRIGMNITSNVNRFELSNILLATQNRWNKISKAIRKREFPYVFSYYMNSGMYITGSVTEFFAKCNVSLINDKEKTKREKLKRKICKWNGPLGKRRRKREVERRRIFLIQRIKRLEAAKRNQIMKSDNKYSERMHGFWYGSADTLNYNVESVKCLLRPTQRVRANIYLISAISHLDRLKDVLQIQGTFASMLLEVINIWNEGGLLLVSRGTSLISERRGSSLDAPGSYLWFRRPRPYPSLRAARHGSIANCMYPLFTPAGFYMFAKRQKLKVEKMKLIEVCGTSHSEFNSVSTSMKGLFFYQFGISKEEKDPTNMEWNQGPITSLKLGWGRISRAFGATCDYPLQVITLRSRLHAQHSSAGAGYFGISYVFRTLQHKSLRDVNSAKTGNSLFRTDDNSRVNHFVDSMHSFSLMRKDCCFDISENEVLNFTDANWNALNIY